MLNCGVGLVNRVDSCGHDSLKGAGTLLLIQQLTPVHTCRPVLSVAYPQLRILLQHAFDVGNYMYYTSRLELGRRR